MTFQFKARRSVGICLAVMVVWSAWPAAVMAADHGDTPTLIDANRRDALITDLHVFARGENLVVSVSMNPAIPPTATTYMFASDLKLCININNTVAVSFDDPEDLETYGGTILDPAQVKRDVELEFTFTDPNAPRLKTKGLPKDRTNEIQTFFGLRDDPFIRAPREGRNVAAIVVEFPLDMIEPAPDTLLVWAVSQVPTLDGPFQDLAGRALRSMFPENDWMNSMHPWRHWTVMGEAPDVVILDTTAPVAFPNGRELTDDVVDLVGDPRVLANDAPFPVANDKPFLTDFPYLAEPHVPSP